MRFWALAIATLFLTGFGTGFLSAENVRLRSCEPQTRNELFKQSLLLSVRNESQSAGQILHDLEVCEQPQAREELLKAHLAFAAGDLQSAEQLSSKSIQLNPREAEAYGLRGQVYFEQRKFFQALRDLDRALELDPYVIEFDLTRTAVLAQLGRTPHESPGKGRRVPASQEE